VTFLTLRIIVYPAIIAINLPCRFAESYRPSMFILSKSNLHVPPCSFCPSPICVGLHVHSVRVLVKRSCRVRCLVGTIGRVTRISAECHQVYYNVLLIESIILPGIRMSFVLLHRYQHCFSTYYNFETKFMLDHKIF
jgi:hypothetical protein